jgi:hypothetical protein
VDRTRPDDNQKARVPAGEDLADLVARPEDRGRSLVGDRKFFFKQDGRKNNLGPPDAEIICAV